MRLKRAFSTLSKLYSKRTRRSAFGRTRAHIEIRALAEPEELAFARAVREGFAELPRVEWVDVSSPLRRVIVQYEEDAYTREELLRVVENAELATHVELAPFGDEAWEHPADEETSERLVVGMAADAIGTAVGLALRFSPVPASRLSGTVASVLAIVQTSPRLRRSS